MQHLPTTVVEIAALDEQEQSFQKFYGCLDNKADKAKQPIRE